MNAAPPKGEGKDFNKEFDTTRVDTPENRRGMVRLFMKYAQNSVDRSRPVFNDLEGSDDLTVDTYLRVLADYSDENLDKPQSLEKALKIMRATRTLRHIWPLWSTG